MIATGPPAKSNRRILCGSESTEGAQRASVQRIVKPHRNLAVGCQKSMEPRRIGKSGMAITSALYQRQKCAE
ncbi:hypothetical protein A3712_14170 [Vibrio sp. HI00D65]|nr:hypothetical protein A3712_14170 [Vibrio sp. HI00D65]